MLDFLHILHDDDLRQNGLCVLVDCPGQDAEPLVAGLAAFSLGVAGAVRGGPHQVNGPACHIFGQVNGENVLREMQGVWMVDPVDADGLRVMVDGNVNGAVEGQLNAFAGPSATCKTVNEQSVHAGVSPLCFSAGKNGGQSGRKPCRAR